MGEGVGGESYDCSNLGVRAVVAIQVNVRDPCCTMVFKVFNEPPEAKRNRHSREQFLKDISPEHNWTLGVLLFLLSSISAPPFSVASLLHCISS